MSKAANLKLDPNKCDLLQKEINYLAHVSRLGKGRFPPRKYNCVVNLLTTF